MNGISGSTVLQSHNQKKGMDHCENQAPSVKCLGNSEFNLNEREKILLSDAESNLKSGTIIVGERHDKSTAREFAITLIEKAAINDIYLELPDLTCDIFGGDENETISQVINTHNLHELKQNPVFEEFSSSSIALTGAKENTIPLSNLICSAREHNVKVHFIDNTIPKSRNIADRSNERNIGMGSYFNELSSASTPKGLILVGANHCAQDNSNNLQSHCGIPDSFFFDISM